MAHITVNRTKYIVRGYGSSYAVAMMLPGELLQLIYFFTTETREPVEFMSL